MSPSSERSYIEKNVLEDSKCPLRFGARKSKSLRRSCDSFRRASELSDYQGMSDELIN